MRKYGYYITWKNLVISLKKFIELKLSRILSKPSLIIRKKRYILCRLMLVDCKRKRFHQIHFKKNGNCNSPNDLRRTLFTQGTLII